MSTTKEKAIAAAATVAKVLTRHEENEAKAAAKRAAEKAAAPKGPTMVRAKGTGTGYAGFYGGRRRRVGEVFQITDGKHFSSSWMDVVSDAAPSPAPPTAAANPIAPTGDKDVI